MRARLMAATLLSSTLVGLGIGPTLVPLLAEIYFSGPFAIGSAILVNTIAFGALGLIAFAVARNGYMNRAIPAELDAAAGMA